MNERRSSAFVRNMQKMSATAATEWCEVVHTYVNEEAAAIRRETVNRAAYGDRTGQDRFPLKRGGRCFYDRCLRAPSNL